MTAEELYEQGKKHLEAGEHEAADEAFTQAIELEPEWAEPWHSLGNLYLGQEKYEEAIEASEQAAALEEENALYWSSLARAYALAKRVEEAREAYQQAIKLGREEAAPWNGLGVLYFEALGKPQNGIQCFLRAEFLSKGRFAGNLFAAFAQLPPYPFFSYRIIRDYMPPEEYENRKGYLRDTFKAALPLAAYLNWLDKKQQRGNLREAQWYLLLGLANYYMGDPSRALECLVKSREQEQRPGLMAAYYQLLACWEFLEPDAPYLEPALEQAAAFLPLEQSGWKFWQKKEEAPPLSGEDVIQCYYAGLVFIEHDEIDKALQCFERIERDFLPAAYQAFWCCEELVLAKKKKEKGEYLLEQEAEQQQFSYGLAPQLLNLDGGEPLAPFLQAVRYLELEEAIERLHMYAEFEGTPQEYEIQNSREQPPFYQLWQFSPEDGERAMALLMEGLENEVFRGRIDAFLKAGEEEEEDTTAEEE